MHAATTLLKTRLWINLCLQKCDLNVVMCCLRRLIKYITSLQAVLACALYMTTTQEHV